MKIRLFARNARPAFWLRRKSGTENVERRWIVLHWRTPPWDVIFRQALELVVISIESCGHRELGFRGGKIWWHSHRKFTKMGLSFTRYSEQKQLLLADSLFKASRYTTYLKQP